MVKEINHEMDVDDDSGTMEGESGDVERQESMVVLDEESEKPQEGVERTHTMLEEHEQPQVRILNDMYDVWTT